MKLLPQNLLVAFLLGGSASADFFSFDLDIIETSPYTRFAESGRQFVLGPAYSWGYFLNETVSPTEIYGGETHAKSIFTNALNGNILVESAFAAESDSSIPIAALDNAYTNLQWNGIYTGVTNLVLGNRIDTLESQYGIVALGTNSSATGATAETRFNAILSPNPPESYAWGATLTLDFIMDRAFDFQESENQFTKIRNSAFTDENGEISVNALSIEETLSFFHGLDPMVLNSEVKGRYVLTGWFPSEVKALEFQTKIANDEEDAIATLSRNVGEFSAFRMTSNVQTIVPGDGSFVNTAPELTLEGNITAGSGNAPRTVPDFASIDPQDYCQKASAYQVTLDPAGAALFSSAPAISPEGTLTFTPAGSSVKGTAIVTVTAQDDGGSANGGSDTSAPQTFLITLHQDFPTLTSQAGSLPLPWNLDPDRFRPLGSLILSLGTSSGTVTINTDTGTIIRDEIVIFQSRKILEGITSNVRVFKFNEISIDSGITIKVTGSQDLALIAENDFTLSGTLNFRRSEESSTTIPGQAGGDGEDGARILLSCEGVMNVTGTIIADGGAGGNGGPEGPVETPGPAGNGGNGGAGGSIFFFAPNATLTGNFSAKGGNGGNAGSATTQSSETDGSGGDGGSIIPFVLGDFSSVPSITVNLSGGAPGSTYGNGNSGTALVPFFGITPPYLTAPRTFYVDASCTGSLAQDGITWETAFADLQDAFNLIDQGDQIWATAGIYHPDEAEAGYATVTADSENESFTMIINLALYGGFTGGESTLAERDFENNLTILSGDITQNDPTSNGLVTSWSSLVAPNSYHIITSTGDATTIIDGVIINAGHANGSADSERRGGGIYLDNDGLLVRNSIILACCASQWGGGVFGDANSEIQLLDSTIQSNRSNSQGGGFWIRNSTSLFNRVQVLSNNGGNAGGGGQNNDTDAEYLNTTFQGNQAANFGGGVGIFGGSALMENCLMSGNRTISATGGRGAGVYLTNNNHSLLNCTLSGNQANHRGGGLYCEQQAPTITNSIIWNNTDSSGATAADQNVRVLAGAPVFNHSVIEGGLPTGATGNNLSSLDPLFWDPQAPSDAPTTEGGYGLIDESPAIDAGDPVAPAGQQATDIRGVTRVLNGNIDIGAYEYNGPLKTFRARYRLASDGSEDGGDLSDNGVPNVYYHLFGLGDPNVSDIDFSRLPKTEGSSGEAKLSYVRRLDSPIGDLEAIVEYSDDLTHWDWVLNLPSPERAIEQNVMPLDTNHQGVEVTFPAVPQGRFYRLRTEEIAP